jgi:hypothetical protein
MYLESYFGNCVDVETIKIDNQFLSVDQQMLEVLVFAHIVLELIIVSL